MADSGDVAVSVGSVSASGAQIAIAATASPGTLLHTAVTGSAEIDHIEIEFFNIDPTNTILLTVQWGGTTAASSATVSLRPNTSTVQVGRLNGGLLVRAFAGTTNVINARVSVDRITL